MIIHIPSPLRSYTNAAQIQGHGATIAELFTDLERQFSGIRFRVINEQNELREHIRIFINQRIAKSLDEPLEASDEIRIVMAISGG